MSDIETRDYSLLGENSRRAVESGLAQAQWYRTDVPRKRMKELMQRRNGPAIRDTALWIGLLVVLGGLGVYLWFSVWSLLCFAAYGVLYGSASDARWHECGHGTAFKTRWMNTIVYNLACFMIMRDPTVWRWSHARHHTDTIIVGRDPEIVARRPPPLGHIAADFLGLFAVPAAFKHMFVHASGRMLAEEATYVPDTERSKTYWTARAWLLIYAIVVVWCIASRSILPAMVIGLPRMYGAWHHIVTGLTQHSGLADDVTDHRLNSRTVYMNPISRFVYWNMNYHVEHHMYPMVPFHSLPALHAEIKDDLPAPSASIGAAFGEFMPVLMRQRKDPSYFIQRQLPDRSDAVRASG
ncbi:MAG TPA: fatty acid desaturase family protein [Ilumatobacteraceae bacterium]